MVSKFEWKVQTRGDGPYQRLLKNIKKLSRENADLLQQAADEATRASRTQFSSERSGRPFTSPRRGRRTTQGRFESHIMWIDGLEHVFFDEEELEAAAPYYLINEVGTGTRGAGIRYRHDAQGNVTGSRVEFPSQKGRYIAPGLAWGDSGNVVNSKTSRYRQDQIHRTASLTLGPGARRGRGAVNPLRTQRVRISREIPPKHYIREGAVAGFKSYAQPLRNAARTTFDRRK